MTYSTTFSNVRFYQKERNWLQPENHEIIVRHLWGKLSVPMPLTGQSFPGSQNEITLSGLLSSTGFGKACRYPWHTTKSNLKPAIKGL